MPSAARFIIILLLLCFAAVRAAGAGEYDFDIPEAEKSNFEFGGKVEFRFIYHQLDDDSIPYKLKFPSGEQKNYTEWRPYLELSADYNFDVAQVFLTVHNEYQKDDWDEEWLTRVYEGYVAFRPTTWLTIDVGKKNYIWGKGYAWNPAGFINRPKDPDDPELNLEGYTAVSVDFIKSFSEGPLQTLAFTPVVLPVFEWENDDLGKQGEVNYAFKLYLLISDVDLDFIYAGGPSQPDSMGMDFSANLMENLEVHGEWALRLDVDKTVVDADGDKIRTSEDQISWLLGVRYLTSLETTYIIEYYHNGAGYARSEVGAFFKYQEAAFQKYLNKGQISPLREAQKTASSYYGQKNYGRDYLYFKASQKEPFDILDFTPFAAVIMNLDDQSLSLSPGFTYIPWTNFELKWKLMIPVGLKRTEFGEKQDAFRTEFTLDYYF